MAIQFHKATKKQSFLRMALIGPSGSGKTYSSLRIAAGLGNKIAVIDSERGSASKYADEFAFDVVELESFSPRDYMDAIHAAAEAGYEVLIIDSLSHAWMGKGGVLEMHDAAVAQERSGNSYTAWRMVTPEHNRLVDAILQAPMHVLATMRSKMAYVQEKDDKGKTVIRKVGLQPIQRDGLDFEFDVVGDMDSSNTLVVTKTRCRALSQAVVREPGEDNVAKTLKAWLTDGVPASITQDQSKALWELAKDRGLSVGALIDLANKTLGTQYTNPREINVEEYPRVVEAVKAVKPEASEEAAS